MKGRASLSITLMIAIFLLQSCATSSISTTEQNVTTQQNTNNNISVTFKDGTKKGYGSLSLVTAILKTPYLLADGKVKIKGKDVLAYTDGKYEAIAQSTFYTQDVSKLATKTLPGFAIKEASGTFNLYSLAYYKNGNTVKKYFLQEGSDGKIELCNAALLGKYDNAFSATKNGKKNSKAINSKTMVALVDRLNNSSSISKK